MSSSPLLLDTHVFFWFLVSPEKLNEDVVTLIERSLVRRRVAVSAISAWELAILVRKKRIGISSAETFWEKAIEETNARVIPVNAQIALLAENLPGEIHGDPGDRMIAATALLRTLTLVTADGLLLRWAKQNEVGTFSAQ